MARRLRIWKALLVSMLGALVSALLGLFQWSRTAEAQVGKAPLPPRAKFFDRHWLPVPAARDTDRDLLMDTEEAFLGLDLLDPDQNQSGLIDGPEVSWKHSEIIAGLPEWQPGDPPPTEIVKTYNLAFGLENCDVCGEAINMGTITITNPWKGIVIDFPLVGLHYLEHGSLGYAGTVHDGRIDVKQLDEVLEDLHRLAVAGDTDLDLLSDKEEAGLQTDPNDPDENGNFVEDGPDLSLHMWKQIEALPQGPLPGQVYRIEHPVFGLENCLVCGETVNMGCVEVTNPMKGLSTFTPYVGVHYMDHGSLSYAGTTNQGRVDVVLLRQILEDA